MTLVRSYESMYYCQQLVGIIGKRYNIRPDLHQDTEQEIKGYVYKETIAGFFRAWKLNETHLAVTAIVNNLQVASVKQVARRAGLSENQCEQIVDECVVMGMLCENHIQFKDENGFHLYLVDTGGIFALEEAGINYQKLNYTTSVDRKIKIYRKNIYLVENKASLKPSFFEDIVGANNYEGQAQGVLLVDMGIATKIGIFDEVATNLSSISQNTNTMIFDTRQKRYIDFK